MGTRVTLAALAIGALVIAVVLVLPTLMPDPDSPGSVDRITLQASSGGEARRAEQSDAADTGRPRRGSKLGQWRNARPAARRGATAHPGSTPGADGGRAVAGPLSHAQSGDAPAGERRRDAPVSTRPRSRAPAPRTPAAAPQSPATTPGGPDAPAPQAEPERAAAEPADLPDPVDPPDPADEDPTTAAVDQVDQPDPAGDDPAAAAP